MNKINIWRKIVMIGGGVIALALVLFNLYYAFVISADGGLLSELFQALVIAVVFLLPACALCKRKETGVVLTKIGILYPILTAAALINILVVDNPAPTDLPFAFIAFVFCVLYGLAVLFQKK